LKKTRHKFFVGGGKGKSKEHTGTEKNEGPTKIEKKTCQKEGGGGGMAYRAVMGVKKILKREKPTDLAQGIQSLKKKKKCM